MCDEINEPNLVLVANQHAARYNTSSRCVKRRGSCMTKYESALTVDFGEVGYRHRLQPFRVRLEIGPLAYLIRDTENAHRVYELLLLDRPGDVWEYVWVVLASAPKRMVERIAQARQAVSPKGADDTHPWPADRVPFNVFDGLFSSTGDDTEPEDSVWLNHRDSTMMRSFSEQALSITRAERSRLKGDDPGRRVRNGGAHRNRQCTNAAI